MVEEDHLSSTVLPREWMTRKGWTVATIPSNFHSSDMEFFRVDPENKSRDLILIEQLLAGLDRICRKRSRKEVGGNGTWCKM
jgi:hypothetical protein